MPRKPRRVLVVGAVVVLAALVILVDPFKGWTLDAYWVLTPEQYVAEYGGDLAAYQELARSSDCEFISNEIATGQNNLEDTGERQWDGYYKAAWQRDDELECE